MAENKQTDSATRVPSASELRMKMLEKEMRAMEESRKARERAQEEHAKFTDGFLKGQVSEGERAKIRQLVMNAVAQGHMEAMVYSFPSSLCADDGRAINSGDRDWPKTLQGKAKQLYDRYKEFAQPQGYKLKAMVINFPGGVPGDIGFFLSWGD